MGSPPPFKGAVRVDYTSNPVDIPPRFLTNPPSATLTPKLIAFAEHGLPEYKDYVALTIDNVLSAEECKELLRLAEASVPRKDESESPWRPALVHIGDGWEVASPGYREGDRIIWDTPQIADRIWTRCLVADGVQEIISKTEVGYDGQWKMHSLNERLRFLKYRENQWFSPHCDGATQLERDGKELRTFYTLHLYLNDSAIHSPTGEGLVGGATTFSSLGSNTRLEVNPKAGSVLIFQHQGLRHEGAEVVSGVKYTVRSDVFFEWDSASSGAQDE